METPAVSVLVPARNAERALTTLLDALARQSLGADRFETVVADDASRDGTARVARQAGARTVSLERRAGSYAARNRALLEARAPIVAFIDADCVPTPEWLERGVADLDRLGVDLLGGKVEGRLGSPARVVELVDFARALDQRRCVHEAGYAATANLFARRDVLEAVGPFNEELVSGGDVEFSLRATAAGYRLGYSDSAAVFHPVRRRPSEVARKGFRTGFGSGQWERVATGPLAAHRAPWRSPANYRPQRDVLAGSRIPSAERPGPLRRRQADLAHYTVVQVPRLAGSMFASLRRGRGFGGGSRRPIHYVSKRFPKLTETFVIDEILSLEAAGERVIVDSLEPPLDEPRHPGLEYLRAGVRYLPEHPDKWSVRRAHLPLAARRPRLWLDTARRARADGVWSEFRRAGLVARRARADRACAIHTHFAYYCADVGGMAAALAGLPFALTAHANDMWQVNNAPHLHRRVARASLVITPTEYNARQVRSVAPGIRVEVLPYAVPPADPVHAAATGPVLSVARLVPKKGVDTLIRALAEIRATYPDARVEIIGDGHAADDTRRLTDDLGLTGAVDFRGEQPPGEVRRAYERCSLFALPCRIAPDGDRDGLPVALLEALAHGLPVVTTSVIGIPESVRDGEAGLLVPPDDVGALARAIDRLLADRELARRLGEGGRRVVHDRHSPLRRTWALRNLLSAPAPVLAGGAETSQ